MKKRKSNILGSQTIIVLIVVIALFILFGLISKDFRKYSTMVSLLDMSYYYLLMAIGVSFPLITGGVDLSIGTGMVCYALTGGYLVRHFGCPTILAILISVLFGVLVGLANGVLVGVMDLPPFLATLCTCMITRGLGSVCSNNSAVPWPAIGQEGDWFHNISKLTTAGGVKIPIGIVWMILMVILMEFMLQHTRFGRYTIAIGSNKEATILSGINVKRYHIMAYVVCGLMAGLASIFYAAAIPTVQPGTGAGYELDAIGGAIVGGVSPTGGSGSIVGTFLGLYVIIVLKMGLPFIGLQANWQQIITGLILIFAVLMDVMKKNKKVTA